MQLNSSFDPQLIGDYHQEYLKLINHYDNFKRPSIFIRYYNINYDYSKSHPEIKSNYELYNSTNKSSIEFDIYDLTPLYNISPIINSTTFSQDKIGQMFEGVSTIVTHTIKYPRIHDLITFYHPMKSNEVFRVINFKVAINAIYSQPEVNWFEMDLEIAPLKTTENLKIVNHYVYDIPVKKYLLYDDYKRKTNLISKINDTISILKKYYHKTLDVYVYNMYDNNYIPLITNQAINQFKDQFKLLNDSSRLFNHLEKPYNFDQYNKVLDEQEDIYNCVYNLKDNKHEFLDDLYQTEIIQESIKLKTYLNDPVFRS